MHRQISLIAFGLVLGASLVMAASHVTSTRFDASVDVNADTGDKVQVLVVKTTYTVTLMDWTVPAEFSSAKGHASTHLLLE